MPDEVLGLLADLRELLQNKMEPPVYVSDRRLVKAIALLKVWGPAWSCDLVPSPSALSASLCGRVSGGHGICNLQQRHF